ncbi:hypothetical protein JA1_002673 [Spathaspora sp. JA1]|nr:hypothetical protein JA1_002673 [Spathaspora sp. JA1]
MFHLYNNCTNPIDDLLEQLERQTLYPRPSPFQLFPRTVTPRVFRYYSAQSAFPARAPVQVKHVDNETSHQIFIYNPRGYEGFDIEVIKRGREHLLVIESEIDKFEKVFSLNKTVVDLDNIELQVNDNDELLITIAYNRESEKEKANRISKIARRKVEKRKEQIRQKKQELEQLERELAEEEQQAKQHEQEEKELEVSNEGQSEQDKEFQQKETEENTSSETEEIDISDKEADSEETNLASESKHVEQNLSPSPSRSPTLEDADDEEFVDVSKSA